MTNRQAAQQLGLHLEEFCKLIGECLTGFDPDEEFGEDPSSFEVNFPYENEYADRI